MSIIIGFLDLDKGIILVSKYWKIITLESKENLISDPEKRKPNEPNYLENNRVLVNQLKSEAGEKGKRIITMKDIISENTKNYNNLDQKLYKKIVERRGANNNKNEEVKTKKVYWEEKSSEQNGNYRNTNNNGNSNENGKIIKNNKEVNGGNGNQDNNEGIGMNEVVEEEEEEEEEEDATPRITIRNRKNVPNGNNDDDGDILKRYGVGIEENEEGEMKQISLSDDGYDDTTQNNGYEHKNEISLEKNDNNSNTISNSQKTLLTENSTEMTPSINGNEEEEDRDRVGNYDHLLVHVKDIRSESQLTDLIEFIQDGYVTIETAAEEKKRLKRRIKGDLLV
jgi:hypothetical protein